MNNFVKSQRNQPAYPSLFSDYEPKKKVSDVYKQKAKQVFDENAYLTKK